MNKIWCNGLVEIDRDLSVRCHVIARLLWNDEWCSGEWRPSLLSSSSSFSFSSSFYPWSILPFSSTLYSLFSTLYSLLSILYFLFSTLLSILYSLLDFSNICNYKNSSYTSYLIPTLLFFNLSFFLSFFLSYFVSLYLLLRSHLLQIQFLLCCSSITSCDLS